MKGYCMFCNAYKDLYPVKVWNKDRTNYYCEKHWKDAQKYEDKSKRDFYEYYKEPGRFDWLSDESKELWRKINSER